MEGEKEHQSQMNFIVLIQYSLLLLSVLTYLENIFTFVSTYFAEILLFFQCLSGGVTSVALLSGNF